MSLSYEMPGIMHKDTDISDLRPSEVIIRAKGLEWLEKASSLEHIASCFNTFQSSGSECIKAMNPPDPVLHDIAISSWSRLIYELRNFVAFYHSGKAQAEISQHINWSSEASEQMLSSLRELLDSSISFSSTALSRLVVKYLVELLIRIDTLFAGTQTADYATAVIALTRELEDEFLFHRRLLFKQEFPQSLTLVALSHLEKVNSHRLPN